MEAASVWWSQLERQESELKDAGLQGDPPLCSTYWSGEARMEAGGGERDRRAGSKDVYGLQGSSVTSETSSA